MYPVVFTVKAKKDGNSVQLKFLFMK